MMKTLLTQYGSSMITMPTTRHRTFIDMGPGVECPSTGQTTATQVPSASSMEIRVPTGSHRSSGFFICCILACQLPINGFVCLGVAVTDENTWAASHLCWEPAARQASLCFPSVAPAICDVFGFSCLLSAFIIFGLIMAFLCPRSHTDGNR